MSIHSVVGPLVTHVISIGVPGPELGATTLVPWAPVAAHGIPGQERLATEFLAALRDSFARSRFR
ncbi:MAG TPA: hypothetical protein PKY48_04080 [Rhodoglobus sp.]|nr:hypothetical protein [Rhodoglobus sp.]HQE46326.1 hypothetical protein [Rhodoglobus sp.]